MAVSKPPEDLFFIVVALRESRSVKLSAESARKRRRVDLASNVADAGVSEIVKEYAIFEDRTRLFSIHL